MKSNDVIPPSPSPQVVIMHQKKSMQMLRAGLTTSRPDALALGRMITFHERALFHLERLTGFT